MLRSLCLLTFALLGACGGGPVYLKKSGAVIPVRASVLAGKKVFVAEFEDTSQKAPSGQDSELLKDPAEFKPVAVTAAELEQWTQERDALAAKTNEQGFYKLGWKKNAAGAKVKEVVSVNPPAPWLTDALGKELVGQGATLASSAAEADLVVAGKLLYINADLAANTSCNIVVDLAVTPRGGSPASTRIHTAASKMAWTGVGEEYYLVLEKSEQRFSVHAIDHIAKVAEEAAAAPAPSPEPQPAAEAPAPPTDEAKPEEAKAEAGKP